MAASMTMTPRMSPRKQPLTTPRAMVVGLPPIGKDPYNNSLGAGHDALKQASVWLQSEARNGRRKIPAGLTHRSAESMTAEELSILEQPARRLIAASGALSARELTRAGRQNADLLSPLTPDERKMTVVMQLLSEKASQKFSTVRAALRHLDADCNGTLDRQEVRCFFRAYDFHDDMSDMLFDYMDAERKGELDYTSFVGFLRPFLEGAVYGDPVGSKSKNLSSRTMGLYDDEAGAPEEGVTVKIDPKFDGILKLIGEKAADRFGSLRKTFSFLTSDRSSNISRSQTRFFFRAFNLPEEVADQFHDALDGNGSGEVSFREFSAVVSPYLKAQVPISPRNKFHQVDSTRQLTPVAKLVAESATADLSTEISPEMRQNLRVLMKDLGDKLPLKFKHARDAFRVLDLERNGKITRSEMRGFFRGFGHPEDVADNIFNLLDPEGSGCVVFETFMSLFDPILGTAFRQAQRVPLIEVADPDLSRRVNSIAVVIGQKLLTKYRNIQEAFRALDLNKDGKVSQYEMRVFVKKLGMTVEQADQFFMALDRDQSGSILYNEFMQLFAGLNGNHQNMGNHDLLRRVC
eukprot:TRINITY_DN94642_c0_g1_i1.p1 TRINITY_DN94642_c0_g1~~TRINITY_DN94642_c0_g1_i1.p1  ORF type:complete len:577 (+),score=96.75 TRINITY_DN94642_c0_g1_i1:199-1929(+)